MLGLVFDMQNSLRHYLPSLGIVGFIQICLLRTRMSIYCSSVFIKFGLNLNLTVLDLGLVWDELLPSYNGVSNYSLHMSKLDLLH